MNESSRRDVQPADESPRLSDADRSAAMEALADHLAAGRLDVDEFDARSALVVAAIRDVDLVPAFRGLGGPPAETAPDPEMARIRTRGRLVEGLDWFGVALAVVLGVLFMVTGWAPPAVAMVSIVVCSIGGRIVLDFGEDYEYEALKKADRRRRIERIEGADDRPAGE